MSSPYNILIIDLVSLNLSTPSQSIKYFLQYFFSINSVSHTHRIQISVTLSPQFQSCFLIRPSLTHICLFIGPQRVISNRYTLSGEFKVNSSRMRSGSSKHEAFVLITGTWGKVFGENQQTFANPSCKKVSTVEKSLGSQ